MDTPPHRLGLERVVEVFSGHDDLVGVTGSGYAIGADLVLTSGQVVEPGAPCHVRPPWSGRWLAAEPVWRGRGGADAVLLRVSEAAWADVAGIEHNRWARVASSGSYRVRCVARGFAQLGRPGGLPDGEPGIGEPGGLPGGEPGIGALGGLPGGEPGGPLGGKRGGLRDAETLSGLVSPPTGAVSKALAVSVLSPELDAAPTPLWHGMSGAALLAEPAGQLIGVAVPGPGGYERRRLDAVPVTALLSDARFRELAGVPPGPLETVSEHDRSVALPALLRPARERLPEDCPDWVLLMARHAVVPFLGRSEELGTLRAWAAEPGPLSIAVLSGRGGTGKTRLAGELCVELAEAGWDAGFLPLDAVTGLLSGERAAFEALRPTLVVVERPEPSSPVVGELVRRLAKHGHNARVRLLLVAREPGEAEWWRRLDTAAGGWLRRLNTTTVQLNAHPLTLAERNEHAVAAMKAFAPSRAALPSPPRLDDPEHGLPLHVHLAALLRLCDGEEENGGEPAGAAGEAADRPPDEATARTTDRLPDEATARTTDRLPDEATARTTDRLPGEIAGRQPSRTAGRSPGGESGGGLIGRFLARERGRWARVWPDGEERLSEATARQAVAVLTLTAPAPAELPVLLTSVPGLRARAPGPAGGAGHPADWFHAPSDLPPSPEGSPSDTRPPQPGALVAARWLGRLFPSSPGSPGGRVAPLGPDLVAEQFLAETEDLDALVLALHDHEGRTVHHLVRMLEVLRLSSSRKPVRQALWSLVASRLGKLVAEAAANPAGGLGDALNAALVLFAGDRQLAETAAGLPAWPEGREVGLPAWPEGREVGLPARPEGPETGLPAEPVGWEDGLGCRALKVTLAELTVRHRRGSGGRLALARALTWLSAGLAAVGKTGEAVVAAAEAVETYAGAPPYEEPAGRAEALFGLGACLLAGGEAGGAFKPAQEAAARYRILAEEDPRHAEHAARAHYNLACALLELGRLDEAVEAFEAAGGSAGFASQVRGVLSVLPRTAGVTGDVSRPVPLTSFEGIGVAAVLPDLAACLAAATVSAVKNTAPTSRNVAHHLHLAAAWLETHDRPAEARAPAAEAVTRLRTLAAEEPGLRAMLVSAAGLLSRLHARMEDLDAAARSAAEAVRNLRALVTLEPDEHRPALADQLLDLGELLLMDDRPEEALAPLQEAAAVVAERRTATAARGRRLLGLCLDELGRTVDGLAHLEIAAELYDVLCLEDGSSYPAHRDEARVRLESARQPGRPAEEPWLPWSPSTARPEEAVDRETVAEETVGRAERRLAECREAVESAGTPGIEQIHAYLSAQATLARAWADAGRAGDGFALAMRAAELLQRHAAPDGPHAIAVGMVAAALGCSLVGLARPKEAIPHLLTAIESYEPHAEASAEFRTELARLMVLETVALSRAACLSDAEAAADRVVELYERLVAERVEQPVALAGALRLQGGIRFAGQRPDGALRSVIRALDLVPSPSTRQERLLVATCLELAGLCLADLHESDAARDRLAAGTAAMARLGSVPPDLVGVHLLALVRLARMRVEEEGPVAGAALYAQILGIRPLPGPPVLDAVVEELARFAGEGGRFAGSGRFAGEGGRLAEEPAGGVAGLVGPLTTFVEGMEREVPLSGAPETYDRFGRCLARLGAAAARVGDTASAVPIAELAVRVYRGLAPVSPAYREPLASALATLAALPGARDGARDTAGPAGLAVLEQAIDLLTQHQDRTSVPVDERQDHATGLDEERLGRLLAGALNRYAAELLERGRAVEALAHCERAADLCDELEDPAVAAVTYAQVGSTLAALDRPQAALEAIAWSLAELDRAELDRTELEHAEPGRAELEHAEPGRAGFERAGFERAELERADPGRVEPGQRERGAGAWHELSFGTDPRRVRAQAIQVRGRVLRTFGRAQEATAHLVEALRLFTELGEPLPAAETAALIADDLLAAGRPQEAAEYARTATTGHEPGTVKHALATQRLARCHMMLGELAAANELVEALIPLARREPDDLTYRAILADSLAQSSELMPLLRLDGGAEAEARAREAIAIYDELLTTGMNAQALHTSRAGACLTLASALRMRDLAAEAIQPLREAVAALERFSPGNPMQGGLLSRAMLMLGDALMEAGRALEAGLVFHRSTQVTRDELTRAVAHARLGFCQQELGRDDAADAALRVSADLLRELPVAEPDLLRDVLLGRLRLLEKTGRTHDAKAIEAELRRLS